MQPHLNWPSLNILATVTFHNQKKFWFTWHPFHHSEFLTRGPLILASTTSNLFSYTSANPYSFRRSSAHFSARWGYFKCQGNSKWTIILLQCLRQSKPWTIILLQCLRQSKLACCTELWQAGLGVRAGAALPGRGQRCPATCSDRVAVVGKM